MIFDHRDWTLFTTVNKSDKRLINNNNLQKKKCKNSSDGNLRKYNSRTGYVKEDSLKA